MAWRLNELVVAGELDNTQFGRTTGWLELKGFDTPLQLQLVGNCSQDLAGWKFLIERSGPEPDVSQSFYAQINSAEGLDQLSLVQNGYVGTMTADQMIKEYGLPPAELARRLQRGKRPAFQWEKCLYLEWVSGQNGRSLVQSTRLKVQRLGERAFELTEDQIREQLEQNQKEMDYYLYKACAALSASRGQFDH